MRAQPATDRLTVTVHPGVELLPIVQLLASKYPPPNKSSYAKATEAFFTPFAHHPAVQLARHLPKVYTDLPELGYYFDNFPAVRVRYPAQTNWYALNGQDTIQAYLRLCQRFVADSHLVNDKPPALDLLTAYLAQVPARQLAGRRDTPVEALSVFG